VISVGVDVAMLIYCPYHSRPLLCDFPNNKWVNRRDRPSFTVTGSGIQFVNFDIRHFRTFIKFINDRFHIPNKDTQPLIDVFLSNAKNNKDLQITHDNKSYYKDKQTGFNWE
jgi:hypothetical protein